MEGTQYEETEAIQECDEEFEAGQGHGEFGAGNESGYQIRTSRYSVSCPSH
jgi:hypothetical protein